MCDDAKLPGVDGLGGLENDDGGAGGHVYRLPPALLPPSAGNDRLGTLELKPLISGNSSGNELPELRPLRDGRVVLALREVVMHLDDLVVGWEAASLVGRSLDM